MDLVDMDMFKSLLRFLSVMSRYTAVKMLGVPEVDVIV